MTRPELLRALRRMKVETGSLVCLGCGHEHSCGTRGCAIIRAAAEEVGHLDWACQKAQLILAEAYGAAEDGPVADALFAVAGQVRQVLAAAQAPRREPAWRPMTTPPPDGGSVFICRGRPDSMTVCVGYYDHGSGTWYEERNWFAKLLPDGLCWTDMPDLPEELP